MLTGRDVREILTDVLPAALIEQWAADLGVVQRQRKLKVVELVYAAVLACSSPNGAVLADVLRAYVRELSETGVLSRQVARSAFYRWFDAEMLELMRRLAEHVCQYVSSVQPDLPHPMGGVTDWRIVDSTTCKLSDAFIGNYQGCGEYAALKVHKTLSVGTGAATHWEFSPAREHDSRHLEIDESWRGMGLLADLGYASLARLKACDEHGVAYVIRLKDNWKPRVQQVHRGDLQRTFLKGSELDALLEEDVLVLDGKAVDASVTLGQTDMQARMVGVPTPKGYCWFLTNLPRRIGPVQVGDIYRVRWEIELDFKLDKSIHVLGEVGRRPGHLENPAALQTMVHASLIASTLTNLLVHRHLQNMPKTGSKRRGNVPPLHANLLAKYLVQAAIHIAEMLIDPDFGNEARWDSLAAALNRTGADPNWRRRPSVLDQMRGWKPQKPKKKSGAKRTK